MAISTIDLFLLDLPLREPFVASHGRTLTRTITVAKITADGSVGWGECSALPAATYTSESAAGSYARLADDLGPRLIGRNATPEAIGPPLSDIPGLPMARSCLEMAVLDIVLRASDRSLADWLGVSTTDVAAGVSIGLGSVDETVAKALALAEEGYGRLKLKIQPDHDRVLVEAVRRALPDIELQVDANGSYPATAVDHLHRLTQAGVDAFEQPFAAGDVAAAADLIGRLARSAPRPRHRTGPAPGPRSGPIPVVADEAVESVSDANALLAAGAMTGLSIKPARVGGLSVARALHDLCLRRGMAATAGGMLETGLGRHALAALAALPGFTLTGDLSPAGRWLAADPWPDLIMTDGRIAVPTTPGIAPEPDPEAVERFTVQRCTIG